MNAESWVASAWGAQSRDGSGGLFSNKERVVSNEVAKQGSVPVEKAQQTLKQLMLSQNIQAQIATALPKHLTVDRFARVALTAMLKTPKLMQCDTSSFMQCILALAQMGLEPDGRLAHLIPFENRKENRVDCQVIVDYKGYVELVMRSGTVANIHADVVCQNDEFEYDRGEIKKHKIDFRKERGDVYAVYSMVRFKDGTEKCEVMSVEDTNGIRDRSQGYKSAIQYKKTHPWITDWNEMAKKTVFKRLSKWLSMSPEIRDAMSVDDGDHVEAIETTTVQRIEQTAASQASRTEKLIGKLSGHGQDTAMEIHEPDPINDPVTDEPNGSMVDRFKARIAAAECGEDLNGVAGDIEMQFERKVLNAAENQVLQLVLVSRLKSIG